MPPTRRSSQNFNTLDDAHQQRILNLAAQLLLQQQIAANPTPANRLRALLHRLKTIPRIEYALLFAIAGPFVITQPNYLTWSTLLIAIGCIGLHNRPRLSIPTLRLLVSIAAAAVLTLQIAIHTGPLLWLIAIAPLTAIILTSLYLIRAPIPFSEGAS